LPELQTQLAQLECHELLVFECPQEQLRDLTAMVNSEMESAMDLNVPFVVDLAAGANWYDLERVEV
jgi:DNA polymerase-1